MLERWPQVCRVKITLTHLFVSKKFNEMPYEVDPTQNLQSFEKYPTLPQDRVRSPRNGLCIVFGRSA